MPLFIVRRDLPPMLEDDLKAGILRTVTCTYEFTDMKWHRTFWDEGASRAYCVYEAASADQLRQHADLARVPCTEVWPVMELDPENLLSAPGALATEG